MLGRGPTRGGSELEVGAGGRQQGALLAEALPQGQERRAWAPGQGTLAVLAGPLDVPECPHVPPGGRQGSPGVPHPDAAWGPGQRPGPGLPGEQDPAVCPEGLDVPRPCLGLHPPTPGPNQVCSIPHPQGAKFAWESAGSGREVCPEDIYGTQEIHVNGAVVLAFQLYYHSTQVRRRCATSCALHWPGPPVCSLSCGAPRSLL